MVAATGNIYAGLWYPIGVAVMTLIVGSLFLRDTKGVNIVTNSGVNSSMFLTAMAPNLLAVEIVKKTAKLDISWMDWLTAFAPVEVILLVSLPLLVYVLYPPTIASAHRVLRARSGGVPPHLRLRSRDELNAVGIPRTIGEATR